MADTKRPSDSIRSGGDELLKQVPHGPDEDENRSNISKNAEVNLGPNTISRPEDYTPPAGYAKGGSVKPGWRKYGW